MDAKLSKALRAIDAQRQDFESPPDTLVNVPDGAGGVAQVPSMWVANNAEDVVLEVTSPNDREKHTAETLTGFTQPAFMV